HHNPTSKDIRVFQKKKEEKDKALLSEHHRIRVSQALSLMNEMLSETVASPASGHRTLSSTRSTQAYRRRKVASSTGFVVSISLSCCRGHLNSSVLGERSRTAAKPSFGQKVQRFTPALGLTQSRGKNRTF
ncbi:CPLN1 protein, partial [Prunella fulvescens]|nr:CPLN1 protein [Prunella fulvescens]